MPSILRRPVLARALLAPVVLAVFAGLADHSRASLMAMPTALATGGGNALPIWR